MSEFRRRIMMGQGGFSVNWNQLAYQLSYLSVGDGLSVEFTDANTAKITTKSTTNRAYFSTRATISVTQGHKYFETILVKSDNASSLWMRLGGLEVGSPGIPYIASNEWQKLTIISTGQTTGVGFEGIYVDRDLALPTGTILYNKNMNIFDLTQMFGEGNEPTTTVEFEAWLQENGINPSEYVPYNTGEVRKMTKPSWIA